MQVVLTRLSTLRRGVTANGRWLTLTECQVPAPLLPCRSVAGCCEPDRRSRTLANREHRGMSRCFGFRFAFAVCCEADQRNTLLLYRTRSELRDGIDACRTVAACQHPKIVQVPYSYPAESSRPGDGLDGPLASCECGAAFKCAWRSALIFRS